MVRSTPLGLCRRIALHAAGAAALIAPSAHAAPWNAVAFTAWQQAVEAPAGCVAVAARDGAGEQMSALDRIRMQQAGMSDGNQPAHRRASYLPAIAAVPVKMEPAAASIGCATFAPDEGRGAAASGRSSDFLASRIVPIRHTGFDAQWARVSTRGAGQANVRSAMLSAGAQPSRRDMVAAVNRWVNGRVQFAEDSVNYGKRDYWADAGETLRRGKGDCEDYAIAKMQILSALGIAREDMFLTLARDTIRRADHAVLVVRLDGQPLVLDNGSDALLDGSVANDFRPVYSFSGNRRFLHGF